MTNQNLLLQDDPFATPDSLEHLPSHHCGQDAEKSLPVAADTKSQMMREINLDLEAHPLDRNPAVLARAVSHIEALERQLADVGKDAARLHDRMIAFADAEYVRGIGLAGKVDALGWEQKAKTGKFDQPEYDAHKKMHSAFGAHYGIYAAVNGVANGATTQAADRIDELAKSAAMYEHVRTLNPSQFTDIWVLNVRGGGSFDDLVLADMDKRKGDRT